VAAPAAAPPSVTRHGDKDNTDDDDDATFGTRDLPPAGVWRVVLEVVRAQGLSPRIVPGGIPCAWPAD
jgi:hypothetical protein